MEKAIKRPAYVLQADMPCSYFRDGRISKIEYFFANEAKAGRYHLFLSEGYRRFGNIFYRNICNECNACRPLRIDPKKFIISRSQKRTLKKNSDIQMELSRSLYVTAEKLELYVRYKNSKHADATEVIDSTSDHETVLNMIHYGYRGTVEMNYYLEDRLIGVGIIDEAADALSSNYFYYDTDFLDRRLGVFSILRELSFARQLVKEYYYLGFYIEENPKMSYKKFFRPNQILDKGIWRDFI